MDRLMIAGAYCLMSCTALIAANVFFNRLAEISTTLLSRRDLFSI